MLDVYYSTCKPLPASLDALFRICRAMTPAEQDAVKGIAERFFPTGEDGLRHNPRADKELGIAAATIEKQRKSGAESAAKRWSTDESSGRLTDGLTDGLTGRLTIQPPTTNHQPPASNPQPPSKAGRASRSTRLQSDWILPKAWGEWALKEQPTWDADAVKKTAERFRDYWVAIPGQRGTKLDWEATWRNWVRGEAAKVNGKPVSTLQPLDKKCACGTSLRFGSTDGQCNPCWRKKTYGEGVAA